jgi:hypothetical protein
MAKYFTGIDGALLFDGKQVARITTWQLTAQTASLETTTLGKYAREFVAGLQSFTGTANIYYYTDSNGKLDGQELLDQVIRTGAPDRTPSYVMTLRLQETPPREVSFKVLITTADIQTTVGQVVTVQISFTGTEPLIDASLAA